MNDPKKYRKPPGLTLTAAGAEMLNNPATGALEDRSSDILGVAFAGIGGRAVMKAAKSATKKALEQFTYTDDTVSNLTKMNKTGKVYTPNRGIKPDNVRKPTGPMTRPNESEIAKKIAKRTFMDYSEMQAKGLLGNAAYLGIEKTKEKLR